MIIFRDDLFELAVIRLPLSFPRHAHEEAVISTLTGADEEVWIDGKELSVRQEETTLYNPGQVQSSRFSSEGATKAECVSLYVNKEAAKHAGVTVNFSTPLTSNPGVGSMLRRAGRDQTFAREMALLLLGELCAPRDFAPPLPRRRLMAAMEWLNDELGRPPSLKQLATVVDLSEAHFVRAFRQFTGMPPHAWQLQRRIQRARHLLRRGDEVVSVAHTLGFSDQAHFSKHFRRITGLTPGAYRRGAVAGVVGIGKRRNLQFVKANQNRR